jgi:hypothetical protein
MSKQESALLEDQAVTKMEATINVLEQYGAVFGEEGISIARIGSWVWIEGEALKSDAKMRGVVLGCGFKLSYQRNAYYWRASYNGRESKLPLNVLAAKHGYQVGR